MTLQGEAPIRGVEGLPAAEQAVVVKKAGSTSKRVDSRGKVTWRKAFAKDWR